MFVSMLEWPTIVPGDWCHHIVSGKGTKGDFLALIVDPTNICNLAPV